MSIRKKMASVAAAFAAACGMGAILWCALPGITVAASAAENDAGAAASGLEAGGFWAAMRTVPANLGTDFLEMEHTAGTVTAYLEEKLNEPVTITVSAAGDVTLGNLHLHGYDRTFRQTYDQQGASYFLANVKPVFEADDMTIVNFEGVLTFCDERVEKTYNMKGDPEYIFILNEGSVEAVSFGNNHRFDYGQQGSDDTVAAFEEAGLAWAYDTYLGYYEVKGLTVGFVSVNEHYDGRAVEAFLEDGIRQLRENGADLVIACCHWGEEKHYEINAYQAELGRKCIDWGADLVLGHHPHVLQGIDVYKGKYIVYSLGNFCFGGHLNPQDKDTMIFQQTFTFVRGEKQEDSNIRVIPCSISSVKNRNNFQPTPAEGEEAERIIDKINACSKDFGIRFDYDGYLTED